MSSLCYPRDCSTPGLPDPLYLLELSKFMSIKSVMLSNHDILCHPLLLPSITSSIRGFSSEPAVTSDRQSIGTSASALVLPMNIQGWFLLGLTGLISMLFKWLSRVLSSTSIFVGYGPMYIIEGGIGLAVFVQFQ